MPLGLYMDVHVPLAITEGLRRRGIDVLTSQEDGTRQMADADLLARSTQLSRLLVTQDEDLLAIADEWQHSGRDFAGVIFCPQLGPGIGQIIEDLELLATYAEFEELRNRVIFLPLQ